MRALAVSLAVVTLALPVVVPAQGSAAAGGTAAAGAAQDTPRAPW